MKKQKNTPVNNDPEFLDYKGEMIMYIPIDDNYFVNDIEFKTLEDAHAYIDNGMEMPEWMEKAYAKGLFEKGGETDKGSWLSWLFW
jgi:hypothetical protein